MAPEFKRTVERGRSEGLEQTVGTVNDWREEMGLFKTRTDPLKGRVRRGRRKSVPF